MFSGPGDQCRSRGVDILDTLKQFSEKWLDIVHPTSGKVASGSEALYVYSLSRCHL